MSGQEPKEKETTNDVQSDTIFVQIASYRDMELKPTLKDLLEKADHPENITIGICWQYGDDENMNEYLGNPQIKILTVNWRHSMGVGWARSEVQKLYNNEKYTLQLDAHHRFVKGWDTELIKMLKDLQASGYPKPIITAYAGVYDPNNPIIYTDSRPFKMVTSGYSPEQKDGSPDHILLFYPKAIDEYQNLTKPIKARFISGHFYFTLGQHCVECKYDPNIYFHGEEITLSVRSYTLGYDIFHPHKLLLWHNYIRNNRVKHWDDHNNKNNGPVWYERDKRSKIVVNDLLTEKIKNYEYGMGTIRTIKDYEEYAGINFKQRTVKPNVLQGIDPN